MKYGKKIRVGNYVVLKYKKNKSSYIKISDIAGMFSFEVGEVTRMFTFFNNLEMDTDDFAVRAVHAVIENMFAVSTIVDAEFQHDIRVAVANVILRAKHPKEDPEKEKEYLDEEKLITDMYESSEE